MQTFLPVPSYWGSATLLDRQRLGKQRVETYQIMQALTGLTATDDGGTASYEPPASVAKHWVTALWRGHLHALWRYQAETCHEWTSRGYADTMHEKTGRLYRATFYDMSPALGENSWGDPPWFGDDEFHYQHRARLVTKDPVVYTELFPDVTGWLDDYTFRWRRSPASMI